MLTLERRIRESLHVIVDPVGGGPLHRVGKHDLFGLGRGRSPGGKERNQTFVAIRKNPITSPITPSNPNPSSVAVYVLPSD